MKIVSYSYVVHHLKRKTTTIYIKYNKSKKKPGELHSYPGQMKIEFKSTECIVHPL